jgi:hypothetical protein
MAAGLLIFDLIYLILATLLYGSSAMVALRCHWVLAAPVFLLVLIAEVGLLTALCPRLVPGRYEPLKHKIYFGWLFRTLLRRILFLPPLKWVIFSSALLRFLALRALGARVAFVSFISNDVDLLDPSLVTIERSATLGARVFVPCHYLSGDRLILRATHIGEGALLAAEIFVGPGAQIGSHAEIGPRAALSVDVTIGERAKIGGCAMLDIRTKVGAGASVDPNVYVAPRTEIPPDAHWSKSSSTRSSAAPAV